MAAKYKSLFIPTIRRKCLQLAEPFQFKQFRQGAKQCSSGCLHMINAMLASTCCMCYCRMLFSLSGLAWGGDHVSYLDMEEIAKLLQAECLFLNVFYGAQLGDVSHHSLSFTTCEGKRTTTLKIIIMFQTYILLK